MNTGKNYAKHRDEPTAKLTGTRYLDQFGLWYSLARHSKFFFAPPTAPALAVYLPAEHAAHTEIVDPIAPNQVPANHAMHADAPAADW